MAKPSGKAWSTSSTSPAIPRQHAPMPGHRRSMEATSAGSLPCYTWELLSRRLMRCERRSWQEQKLRRERMISDDERYKDRSAAITGKIQLIRDAFKLFLQLFTTVAGGSIWLNMQTIPTHAKIIYAIVTDVLVALIFLVTSLMVYAAMQSWWKSQDARRICWRAIFHPASAPPGVHRRDRDASLYVHCKYDLRLP